MRANLKLVGGNAKTRTITPTIDVDKHTQTATFEIESLSDNRASASYWRDYATYHQNVKSVVHTSKVFGECLIKWKADTAFTSSMTEIVLHPAYQRIIGLGPDVMPFILNELNENGGHWFWALQALTGENPVLDADRGRPKRMASAWIEWGKRNRLI